MYGQLPCNAFNMSHLIIVMRFGTYAATEVLFKTGHKSSTKWLLVFLSHSIGQNIYAYT